MGLRTLKLALVLPQAPETSIGMGSKISRSYVVDNMALDERLRLYLNKKS